MSKVEPGATPPAPPAKRLSTNAVALAADPDDAKRRFDVVVIGSGYGGAVAAARLAACNDRDGHPVRVAVLEMGNEVPPGAFPDRFALTIPELRIEREGRADSYGAEGALYRFHVGDQVSALVGSGLGGGSLINAGVAERPTAAVFEQAAWPRTLAKESRMAPDQSPLWRAFARAEQALGVTRPTAVYPKTAALQQSARTLGTPVTTPRIAVTFADTADNGHGVPQRACIDCGNCVSGCNHGAKNTLPMNYLAQARSQGACLYTGVRVDALQCLPDGSWHVHATCLHDSRQPVPGAPVPGSLTLWAKKVVVAAGTFGSPRILHRSAVLDPEGPLRHLRTGSPLGQGFSCNGDVIGVGYGQSGLASAVDGIGADPSCGPKRRGSAGPTITGMVDLRSRKPLHRQIVIQDAVIPFALERIYMEILTTGNLLHGWAHLNRRQGIPQPADDPAAIDAAKIVKSQTWLAIGHDDAGWAMDLQTHANRSTLRITPRPRKDIQRAYHATDTRLTLMTGGALGGRYLPNPLWEPAPQDVLKAMQSSDDGDDDPLNRARLLTVHPLGGCRMAERPRRGVVDAFGRVFAADGGKKGLDSLLVLDGSIMPTSLGINPLLTIAALAERACEALIEHWKWTAANKTPEQLPNWPDRTLRPYTGYATDMYFAEQMDGGVRLYVNKHAARFPNPTKMQQLQAVDGRATCDISFTVKDLATLARSHPHGVHTYRARLKLWWMGQVFNEGQPTWSVVDPTLNPPRPGTGHEIELGSFDIDLLKLLPSTPEQRVWDALQHYWATRGKSDLRDRIKNRPLRWLATKAIEWLLRRRDRARFILKLIDWLPASLPKSFVILASHHGEGRVIEYRLPDLQPHDTPFNHPVRVLAFKHLRYADAPTPLPRVSKGVKQGCTPAVLPSNPWRMLGELRVLMLSEQEGEPLAAADCPPGLRPAWLDGRWKKVAEGTLTLNVPRLVGSGVPRLLEHESLPDAWLDQASFALFGARALFQTYFWRFRLPAYPPPLVGTACGVDVGPLPGQRLDPASTGRPGCWIDDDRHPCKRYWIDPTRLETPQAVDGPSGTEPRIVLSHFASRNPNASDLAPVLLFHGYVTSGYQYATPRLQVNAVDYLLEYGHDVWVVDLRTSVALPSSHRAWTFDEVAKQDVPAAFAFVSLMTGVEQLNVVAHCMGSAVFNMAVLGGHLQLPGGRSRVLSAVQAQVSMDVVPTRPNAMKASAARMFEALLGEDEFTVVADAGVARDETRAWESLLDRFLMTWPVSDYEAKHYTDNKPDGPRNARLATCNRINSLYGRNFDLDRLSDDMRAHLHEVFRHAHLTTFRHVIELGRVGHVVEANGRDAYVSPTAIQLNYGFPVRFLHGSRASVFGQRSTARSFKRLQQIHPDVFHDRLVLRQGAEHGPQPLKHHWGHFDIWLSEQSKDEVFPWIVQFFDEHGKTAATATSRQPLRAPTMRHETTARPPLLGPWLGWWRSDPVVGGIARLWFKSAMPTLAQAEVYVGRRTPGTSSITWSSQTVTLIDGCGVVDVACLVPTDITLLCIDRRLAQFPSDDPELSRLGLANSQTWELGPILSRVPASSMLTRVTRKVGLVETPATTVRQPGAEIQQLPDPVHPRQTMKWVKPEDAKWVRITQPLLDSLVHGSQVTFYLASCRYQATDFEQLMADSAIPTKLPVPAPHFALLVGDQIYADATAGVLDGLPTRRRLRAKYDALWHGALGELGRTLPLYLCGDDHEVRDNWYHGMRTDGTQAEADALGFESLLAHQELATPRVTLASGIPVPASNHDYAFTARGFHVYVLDARYERAFTATMRSMSMCTSQQFARLSQWAKACMAESIRRGEPERPLLVASSVAVLPYDRDVERPEDLRLGDGWQSAPQQLRTLFETLVGAGCRHVVFLAGDRHCSQHVKGEITLDGKPSLRVDSVVSSGMHAPVPFANTRLERLHETFDRQWPPGVKVVYETKTSADDACFSLVQIQRKLNDATWTVSCQFV